MGGCVHRAKPPPVAVISQATKDFLSYVRPLDLIVFRDTPLGPIDCVEVVITSWWRDNSIRPTVITDHEDKATPPRRMTGPYVTAESISDSSNPRARAHSDSAVRLRALAEACTDGAVAKIAPATQPPRAETAKIPPRAKTAKIPPRAETAKIPPVAARRATMPRTIKPRSHPDAELRYQLSTYHLSPLADRKRRAFLEQVDNVESFDIGSSESTIATGRRKPARTPRRDPAPDHPDASPSAEPDSPTKLYVWGEQASGMGYRIVRTRALVDLAQSYVDNPSANIGVCRLTDNPAIIAQCEPVYRFEARAKRVRTQLLQAYTEFLNGDDADDDLVGFVAAMFPTIGGLPSADPMDIERLMRNNAWIRRSALAAVVYNRLGFFADLDDSESLDIGPIDFSGEYMIGPIRPICDLPPYWIK